MARWKLMTPHYLNVEGETWEYTENDRQTGRQRVQFPVPASLISVTRVAGPIAGATRTTKTAKLLSAMQARVSQRTLSSLAIRRRICFRSMTRPKPSLPPLKISGGEAGSYGGDYSQSLIDKFQVELAQAQAKSSGSPVWPI